MGKIVDFLLSEDWESYKRIQLYKKLGKTLDSLTPTQLEKIKMVLKEKK